MSAFHTDLTSDFVDFQEMGWASESVRRGSVSSNTSTNSNVDSDQRDLIYAQYYFMDSSTREDNAIVTSSSSSSSPSSNVEFVVISDTENSSYDDIVSTSTAMPISTSTNARKSREKKALKKRKKKKWEQFKEKKKSKISKAYYDESRPMMELDSDFEDGNESPPSSGMIVTSDRQASVQARLPDKMSPSDKWFLIEKDLLGRDQYEKLYEFNRYSMKQLKCHNCKQKGHRPSDCPQAKRHTICYLCGIADHVSSRCPDNICQYCFQKSHRGRPCRADLSNPRERCRRCHVKGHSQTTCPEQWRQFHNTTHCSSDLYQYVVPRDNRQRDEEIYCFNCAEKGHFGFECGVSRPRGYPTPFMPLIVKYDEQLFWELQDQRVTPPPENDDGRGSNEPKSKHKKRRKRRNKQKEEEDHSYNDNNQSAKQSRWDNHPRHHSHSVAAPPPPQPSDEYSRTPSKRDQRRNSTFHYSEPERRTDSYPPQLPPGGGLPHEYSSKISELSPLIPVPPPRTYHGSIHERLEPLRTDLPPTPRQVRSLSFEHNRIPDEYFNSPAEPPRWAGQSPTNYPRSLFPSTSTPKMPPPDHAPHLSEYSNPHRSSYSGDSDHYGHSSFTDSVDHHTPTHRHPLIPHTPSSSRVPPLKRRWSGSSSDYPPYKKRY